MTHQHTDRLLRSVRRISPFVLAMVLALPAIPAAATPEGSRSKQQNVERHQGRSSERSKSQSTSRPREHATPPRDDHGRDDKYDRHGGGHDGRDVRDYKDRHDRYDHDRYDHDRYDHDRYDHDRYDHRSYDRRDRYYSHERYDHGPYFYQSYVHRYYRPSITIPRAITFGYDSYYDPYYWGRVYVEDHHHFHNVYLFPVYVDDALVYRPYSYCEGNLFATGYFTAQGPFFDITLAF